MAWGLFFGSEGELIVRKRGRNLDFCSIMNGFWLQHNMFISPINSGHIRLTERIPEIRCIVDTGKIALNPAVELSYLILFFHKGNTA